MLQSLTRGFSAPFRAGIFILKTPSVLGLVAIPLTLNFAIYALFFVYGSSYLETQLLQLTSTLPVWIPEWLAQSSYWLLRILAWLTLIVVSALSFTVVGGILAAPFSDLLSRRTAQIHLKNRLSHNPELARFLAATEKETDFSIVTTIRLEFWRTLILVCGGIFATILAIIPFMQIPAAVIGAMLLSFEYFGYPMSRTTAKLTPVWGFVIGNASYSLGLGLGLLFLMALPVVGIVYIPLAVVGSTLLYEDLKTLSRK